MLYILSGLPGTGKSKLSQFLSKRFSAVYVRIDSIEQTLKNDGIKKIESKGYTIAYKIALDNLQLGLSVVADSVNPLYVSREAWRDVAEKAGSNYYEIEVICSDKKEHRKRVELRSSDIKELRLPTWKDVLKRNYEPWVTDHIVIDTAGKSISESQNDLEQALKKSSAK